MNTKLPKEVIDRMRAHSERAVRDLRASQMKATGDTWKPVLTEQQKQEHEQYMKDNKLPF